MLCESCGKNNATVHYTKIINGSVEEYHICDECAMNGNEIEFDTPFSFHKLLTSLIDTIQEGQMMKEDQNIQCKNCGLTYSKFKQTGKFGCSKCYETFKNNLELLLKGIHGHNEHVGKIPRRSKNIISLKREVESLKEELEKVVAKEEFEKAALLRDKIRTLKEELDNCRE